MKTLTAHIATADVPNLNDRTYSRDTLNHAIAEYQNYGCVGTIGMSIFVDPDEISHTIHDMRWDGDKLVGTVVVQDTHRGRELEKLLNGEQAIMFRTAGKGTLNEDGTVTDFTITSINAVFDGA